MLLQIEHQYRCVEEGGTSRAERKDFANVKTDSGRSSYRLTHTLLNKNQQQHVSRQNKQAQSNVLKK